MSWAAAEGGGAVLAWAAVLHHACRGLLCKEGKVVNPLCFEDSLKVQHPLSAHSWSGSLVWGGGGQPQQCQYEGQQHFLAVRQHMNSRQPHLQGEVLIKTPAPFNAARVTIIGRPSTVWAELMVCRSRLDCVFNWQRQPVFVEATSWSPKRPSLQTIHIC